MILKVGRGGGIRTPDPLLPKQMRYQTALRPDSFALYRVARGVCVDLRWIAARGLRVRRLSR